MFIKNNAEDHWFAQQSSALDDYWFIQHSVLEEQLVDLLYVRAYVSACVRAHTDPSTHAQNHISWIGPGRILDFPTQEKQRKRQNGELMRTRSLQGAVRLRAAGGGRWTGARPGT